MAEAFWGGTDLPPVLDNVVPRLPDTNPPAAQTELWSN